MVQTPADPARPAVTPAAAPPPVQRAPAATPPNSTVPTPGSVEAAMLELLHLPPDTSVYGLKSPERRATPASSDGPVIQRKPLDEALADSSRDTSADSTMVQRVVEIGEISASVEGEGGGQAGEPDIDDLARKVYRVLKDRLRTERERSSR
jgi:hypothetical protein